MTERRDVNRLSSEDVVIACVAENRPNWYRMVENLAISIRNFGGRLAGARIAAYFIDGIDQDAARDLRGLGVDVRQAPRYDAFAPVANKLRMFEDFAVRQDAPYLLAIDCDTVVVQDFLDEAQPGKVTAMAAGSSPLTNDKWIDLLTSLELSPATEGTTMLRGDQVVPAPYLNSGVMFVPVEVAVPLVASWSHHIDEFTAQARAGIDEAWTTGWYLEQIGLCCALLATNTPVSLLPPKCNLPTSIDLRRYVTDADEHSFALLHYHRHIGTDGLMLGNKAPSVDRRINHVNDVIAARVTRSKPSRAGSLASRVKRRMA